MSVLLHMWLIWFKVKLMLWNFCLFYLQVSSIEQEFNYLQKLKHDNLIQYISMKYVQEKECLVIYIVQVSWLKLGTCI
jgi:translation initiation factor 2-alpha kinase 4